MQQHGQLRHVYSKVPIDVHNFHPDEISKPGANRNHHETFSSVSCSQYPRCSGLPAAQGHTRGAPVVWCSFKEQVWKEQGCHHHCCAHCMEIQLEEPKGTNSGMPNRLHSADFPGQWLSSLLCVEYIVPWTLLFNTSRSRKPFPKTLFSFSNLAAGYLRNELLHR